MSERQSGRVQSVSRALSVLRAIAASEAGLPLTQIAERTSLPASSVHRFLTTLEAERFVRFDVASGVWQIGVGAFETGSAFARTRNLPSIARPHLVQLRNRTSETVNLFVEHSGYVVCLDQVESRHLMRVITQIGGRLPMFCSGAGKAILAFNSNAKRESLLRQQRFERLTHKTITDVDVLRHQLHTIAQSAVAIDDEEHAEGLLCIASPILSEAGHAVAAVSVSGPVSRLTDARIKDVSAEVLSAAQEITHAYCGQNLVLK